MKQKIFLFFISILMLLGVTQAAFADVKTSKALQKEILLRSFA